jgi:succinate dehydrogenase / fumarate reductase, iron-sulfur subunit
MASTARRVPEQYRTATVLHVGDFHVDELAADMAGSLSPFGPEVEFPLPVEKLRYTHPGPDARPHLADGR